MNIDTIEQVRTKFLKSQKALLAIGDEIRQNIILALMDSECSVGMRVGEITEKTHLSRPAVSHHLKILKDAEIISLRKEGTMNFYTINVHGGLQDIISLASDIKAYSDYLKEEKGE